MAGRFYRPAARGDRFLTPDGVTSGGQKVFMVSLRWRRAPRTAVAAFRFPSAGPPVQAVARPAPAGRGPNPGSTLARAGPASPASAEWPVDRAVSGSRFATAPGAFRAGEFPGPAGKFGSFARHTRLPNRTLPRTAKPLSAPRRSGRPPID